MGWTQASSERILHIWKTEVQGKNENILPKKNSDVFTDISELGYVLVLLFVWLFGFFPVFFFSFISFSCISKNKISTKKLNSFPEDKIESHKVYEVSKLLDSWLHDNRHLPYFSFFNWCWKHWDGRRIMHMITATVGILLALQMRTMAYHREATECLKAPTVAACLSLLCSRICFLKSTIYIFLLEGRLHIFLLKIIIIKK